MVEDLDLHLPRSNLSPASQEINGVPTVAPAAAPDVAWVHLDNKLLATLLKS